MPTTRNTALIDSCPRFAKGLLALWVLGQCAAITWGASPGFAATFGGDAQHTANYQASAQNLNAIRWQTSIDLNPSGGFAHYGAPLISAANTVFVPVKTASDGFQVNVFNGVDGTPKYTLTTSYVMPSHRWIPTYNPALAAYVDAGTGQPVLRLYYPGPGGTISRLDNPDSSSPGSPAQVVFFGLANYQNNAAAFNSTVFVNTPLTPDSKGNIFFGFRVEGGTAPSPLSTTQSGFARINSSGVGSYVLAGNAAGDGAIGFDNHNSAAALSNDEGTLYVVVKSAASSTYGYLLGLDTTTMATKYKVLLKDPRNGGVNGASLSDDSTASPTIGPDGDVYLGVLGNPSNGSRGFLLHFSADLSVQKIPGGFGWDYTPALVPASMVPSYSGPSSYLIFAKYNNYAIGDGDGENKVALLDPNATQIDPHPSANGLVEMREVLTVSGPTPDSANVTATFPNARREWCINTAAVNPATKSIFVPSEDGSIHRWDLVANSLSQSLRVSPGIGEPYVPTVIGPDGTVITMNGGTLFALGAKGGINLALASSNPDLRNAVVGQALTFTVTATVSGAPGTGTITFQDVYYPPQSSTSVATVLAQNVPLAAGQANVSSSALAAGSHFITAIYNGTAGNVTRNQLIHPHDTMTAVAASPNPSSLGQSVQFTATVSSLNGGTPTGMVSFREGAALLAQLALDGSGTARFTTPSLGIGTHAITAAYASDTLCTASSGTVAQVVRDITAPTQPTGLRATPGPNKKQVTLSWSPNPPADGVTAYEVWRAASQSGAYSQIGTTSGTSYVDSLQGNGQTRWYYVIAKDASGNRSVPSASVAGTPR